MKIQINTALKGMAMGIAEVIPGVSGGTIAFITGIYEKLIDSIKAFGPQLFTALREEGITGAWKSINGNFLLALLLGMAFGIVVGVFGITHLLEHYPILLWAFFFGLIIASAIYVARQVGRWSFVEILALLVGAVFAYWITIAIPAEGNTALWFVFLSGAIAISALLLPGISGSFILLLMGMYTFIIPTIKTALKTFDAQSLQVLVVFALGCLLGLATFSRVLSWTFKHFKTPTLALLTGFMIGSLNKIWPWRIPEQWLEKTASGEYFKPEIFTYQAYQSTLAAGNEVKLLVENNVAPSAFSAITGDGSYLLGAVICAILGFVLVFIMERLSYVSK